MSGDSLGVRAMDRLSPDRHTDGLLGGGSSLSRPGFPREGGCSMNPARIATADSRFRGSTLDLRSGFIACIAVYNDFTLFGSQQPLDTPS